MEDRASPNTSELSARDMARAAIRVGKLPNPPPREKTRNLRRHSAEQIRPDQTENEMVDTEQRLAEQTSLSAVLERLRAGFEAEVKRYRLHARCFAAWEFERDNLYLVGGRPPAP
jgi:hypothetical protein